MEDCKLKLPLSKLIGVCLLSLIVSSVNAALVSRLGGQAIYDTDLDITWLANTNLAESNTFGVTNISFSGLMTWDTAVSWIGAMNAANYLGFNNWRLPTTLANTTWDRTCTNVDGTPRIGPSDGFTCLGSEMNGAPFLY